MTIEFARFKNLCLTKSSDFAGFWSIVFCCCCSKSSLVARPPLATLDCFCNFFWKMIVWPEVISTFFHNFGVLIITKDSK